MHPTGKYLSLRTQLYLYVVLYFAYLTMMKLTGQLFTEIFESFKVFPKENIQ